MNAPMEARFDVDNLYREEVYTDRRVGTIRSMVPIQADGSPDTTRKTLYAGQVSIMTPMGTLPISFELDTATLAEAIAQFAEGASAAVDEAMRELQQMRREQASSLVLPGAGDMPSASKLRMP